MIPAQTAYQMCFAFLSLLYIGNRRRYAAGLPTLLGSMQILADEQPANPFIGALWSQAVDARSIRPDDLFDALLRFLTAAQQIGGDADLAALITFLQTQRDSVWTPWLEQSLARLEE